MNPTDKRLVLQGLKVDDDLVNRLFFAARNLSIECAMRRCADYLSSHGCRKPTVSWCETMSATHVTVELAARPGDRRMCAVARSRERFGAEPPFSSRFYALVSVTAEGYYRGRTPKIMADLDEVLATPEFFKMLEKEVDAANYPFPYSSSSAS